MLVEGIPQYIDPELKLPVFFHHITPSVVSCDVIFEGVDHPTVVRERLAIV